MKNKKDLLGGIIVIVLLILVLVTYMSFYNLKKDEENIVENQEIKDNSLFMINIYDDNSVMKIENKSDIDNTKSVIGSYNCKLDDCDFFDDRKIYDNKFIVLKENNKLFIYDFTLNKVVSDFFDEITKDVNEIYYVVKKDNKYGIITKSGIKICDSIYDEVIADSIYDSYIKVEKDNLYGILDLDNGNIVIDTKYEDIKFSDSKYYSILKDNLWYVIDNEENVITEGYKDVFAFNKGFVALIDNNLNIVKYNKDEFILLNKILIPIYDKYNIKRNGNTINIEVYNEDVTIKYQYAINRNNLINK